MIEGQIDPEQEAHAQMHVPLGARILPTGTRLEYRTYNENVVDVSAITDHKSDSETEGKSTHLRLFFTIISSVGLSHQDNASLNPMMVSIAAAR